MHKYFARVIICVAIDKRNDADCSHTSNKVTTNYLLIIIIINLIIALLFKI